MTLTKRRQNKSASQTKHAIRRARERTGINLSQHGCRDIVRQIQSGDARLLLRQSNRVSLWLVESGAPLVVAYDKHRKTLATVITVAMFASRWPHIAHLATTAQLADATQ